jgi:hypothetical protein
MTATLQKTQVDLSGLMRVLSEALYSTPFVVIRELVQNCHDSCTRRRLEYGHGFEPMIEVRTQAQTLIFTDNGAGLTEAILPLSAPVTRENCAIKPVKITNWQRHRSAQKTSLPML